MKANLRVLLRTACYQQASSFVMIQSWLNSMETIRGGPVTASEVWSNFTSRRLTDAFGICESQTGGSTTSPTLWSSLSPPRRVPLGPWQDLGVNSGGGLVGLPLGDPQRAHTTRPSPSGQAGIRRRTRGGANVRFPKRNYKNIKKKCRSSKLQTELEFRNNSKCLLVESEDITRSRIQSWHKQTCAWKQR